jgi:hypothetical protein
MVQLEPCRDFPALSLVVKPMGWNQPVVLPKACVPILLDDGEEPTSGCRVNYDIRFVPVSPLRNFGMVPNAASVLFLRANLHMIRVAAISDPAKVVGGHVAGNRPVSLLPVPAMREPKPSIAPNAAVAVNLIGREFPAAGSSIDDVLVLPTMAGNVHLRRSGDVPEFGLQSNRSVHTTPAETFACPSDTFGPDLVVPAQESAVASRHSSVVAVESDQRFGPTSASAKPRRVRAARVIRSQHLTPAACGTVAQSRIVTFDETGLRGQLNTASAFAKVAGAIWCGLWWPVLELRRKQRGIVAVDEPSAARKSAVGTICDLAAPTFAKLAKIDLGHMISLKDLWSAGTGVHALGQPFDCNREVA